MRIIGGHDYYDTALSFGHDTHTTFVRGEAEISQEEALKLGIEVPKLRHTLFPVKKSRKPMFRPTEVRSGDSFYSLFTPSVIVCGKRYDGIRVLERKFYGSDASYYFWDLAKLTEWLAERGLTLKAEKPGWREPPMPADALEKYFEPTTVSASLLATLVDRRWTILVRNPLLSSSFRDGEPWLIDQPILKTVEFYKVVPPNLLFQEIDMWIGGRLPAQGRMMAEVCDADRLAKHGMDKTSFRKPKQAR